jgi:glucose/arabinose dehydrogenase
VVLLGLGLVIGCSAGIELVAGDPDAIVPSTSAAPGPRATGELPVLGLGEPIAVIPDALDLRVRPGSGEIYIAERLGRIHRLGDGVVLDISSSIEPGVEEGVLGMTFSPTGETIYLNVTSESMTRIVEYGVNSSGEIDVTSERVLLEFEQPREPHNGGELLFDPSGMLLVFTGDGGAFMDHQRVALDLESPLGKILRIDPTPEGDRPYRVPADNPFVDVAGDTQWTPLIWSYGLRNPWRGHLDPETGDLVIGDVGNIAWEELNIAWGDERWGRGLSFGWSAFEGPERLNLDQPATGHTPPFHAYAHGEGRCSVTAGEIYRGQAIPALRGWLVFTDFCDGRIRALEITADREPGREVIADGEVRFPVAIRSGPEGELYVISIKGAIVPLLATR